jgi:hypothetical protein
MKVYGFPMDANESPLIFKGRDITLWLPMNPIEKMNDLVHQCECYDFLGDKN